MAKKESNSGRIDLPIINFSTPPKVDSSVINGSGVNKDIINMDEDDLLLFDLDVNQSEDEDSSIDSVFDPSTTTTESDSVAEEEDSYDGEITSEKSEGKKDDNIDDSTESEEDIDESKEQTNQVKSSTYYDTYIMLSKLGIVKNPEVITIDEEGNQIPIDEYLDSEEALTTLIEHSKVNTGEDIVRLDNLDDLNRDVIRAIADGIPLNNVLEPYLHAQSVVNEIDLDTEVGQRLAITEYYRQKGMKDSEIRAILQGYAAEGTLSTEAVSKYEELIEMDKSKIAKTRQDAETAKKEAERKLNEHIASVKTKLKEIGVSDHKTKVLTQKYMTVDNDRGNIKIWKAFEDAIRDPEKMTELMLYLENPSEFKKTITSSALNNEKLEAVRSSVSSASSGKGITIISPNKQANRQNKSTQVVNNTSSKQKAKQPMTEPRVKKDEEFTILTNNVTGAEFDLYI